MELLATSLELLFSVFNLGVVSQDLDFQFNQMREGGQWPLWFGCMSMEKLSFASQLFCSFAIWVFLISESCPFIHTAIILFSRSRFHHQIFHSFLFGLGAQHECHAGIFNLSLAWLRSPFFWLQTHFRPCSSDLATTGFWASLLQVFAPPLLIFPIQVTAGSGLGSLCCLHFLARADLNCCHPRLRFTAAQSRSGPAAARAEFCR
jgi:hypothetical protein